MYWLNTSFVASIEELFQAFMPEWFYHDGIIVTLEVTFVNWAIFYTASAQDQDTSKVDEAANGSMDKCDVIAAARLVMGRTCKIHLIVRMPGRRVSAMGHTFWLRRVRGTTGGLLGARASLQNARYQNFGPRLLYPWTENLLYSTCALPVYFWWSASPRHKTWRQCQRPAVRSWPASLQLIWGG